LMTSVPFVMTSICSVESPALMAWHCSELKNSNAIFDFEVDYICA
jgi:hypothetical protein